MSQHFWVEAGNVAFYGLAGVSALFVLAYFLLSPWWKTETGRNIMAVMGSLALTAAYFSLAISQGGVPWGFYPIRFLLFSSLLLAVGWRLVLFVRAQLLARSDKTEKKEEGNVQ